MTKSPAKWIKRVLFGKKSKLHASRKQKAAGDDSWVNEKGVPSPSGVAPIISHPLHVISSVNITFGSEKNSSRTLPTEAPLEFNGNDGNLRDGSGCERKYSEWCNSEVTFREGRGREEQAATKIQAMFRGYQARKAFHVLGGIIRLQALIRGHLVRRQASATLLCICGIIRLQATVRGQKVRLLGTGIGVSKTAAKDAKHLGTLTKPMLSQKTNLSSNGFVSKFLSSMRATKPLQMQYTEGEPNSAWTWLERWTNSHFWVTISQQKKASDSKSKVRLGSHGLQAGSGISKRNVRKVPSVKPNTGSKGSDSQLDRRKHSIPKVVSLPMHHIHEQQTEHAKVTKKSSKKVINSAAKTGKSDGRMETMSLTIGGISNSEIDVAINGYNDSAEKIMDEFPAVDQQSETLPIAASVANPYHSPSRPSTKGAYLVETIRKPHVDILILHETDSSFMVETIPNPAPEPNLEGGNFSKLPEVDAAEDVSDGHHNFVELNPRHDKSPDKDQLPMNEPVSSNEEYFQKNLGAIKTDASTSMELENLENDQESPLPLRSYMASTASTKAKLRSQSSPKVSPGSVEKNGNVFISRRAISPSSNGKLSHRLGQPTVKGVVKSDKNFSSSRDKSEKLIQAEWRR